jgi:hypothetical protein
MLGNRVYKKERETERERIGEGERQQQQQREKMAWVILTFSLNQHLGICLN